MDAIDVDITVPHPSFVDRYFTRKYKVDVCGKPGEDQCILTHSNKLFIVTIAPSHPILREKKTIADISFQVSDSVNLIDCKAVGKSKRGATHLSITSPLCHVTCSDQTKYTLHSCIRGNLIEVNENLVKTPSLLVTDPETEGYIAIVNSALKDHPKELGKLKSQEDYDKIVQDRIEKKEDKVIEDKIEKIEDN